MIVQIPPGLLAESRSAAAANNHADFGKAFQAFVEFSQDATLTKCPSDCLTQLWHFYFYNLSVIHHNWIKFYTWAPELLVHVPSHLI